MQNHRNSASNVALARRQNADPRDLLSPFGSRKTGLFDEFYPLLSGSLPVSPFQLMERMQQDMDRLFSQVMDVPSLSDERRTGQRQDSSLLSSPQLFAPTVDVSETEWEYRIDVDLPGVSEEAIDVRVVESTLIVQAEAHHERNRASGSPESDGKAETAPENSATQNGQSGNNAERQYHYRERRWGRFERVFHLPPDADDENIGANFVAGVLTLTIPKKARQVQQPQGRRIAIGSAGQSPGTVDGHSESNRIADADTVASPS